MITEEILNVLLEDCEKAYFEKEIPVSAIIVDKDNNIVSHCFNKRQQNNRVIDHAEILSILDASNKIGDWRLNGYSMIVTLCPCKMCAEVIKESRLDNVYYILESKYYNSLSTSDFTKIEVPKEYEEKLNKLLTLFFDNMR